MDSKQNERAGRRVLVTGASRGIGAAIALDLARMGFDIVVNARSQSPDLLQTLEQIRSAGVAASPLIADVADRRQIRSAIEADIEAGGAYYGVVCNAGMHRDNAFPVLSEADWDDVIRVNLDGFFNVVQPCVMPMIGLRSGGRIVSISSVSGLMGNRGQTNYSAAKAGLFGATKALAVELAKRRITVNCVAPGIIETGMTDGIPDAVIRDLVPLRRRGTATEVASLVSYLFSEEAGYVTRQVISVNGGMA